MTLPDVSAASETGPVLITGASGFLGAWLTAALIERGIAVSAFDVVEDRTLLGALVGHERAASVDWTVGDITDSASVDAMFDQSDFKEIIHLAALTIPACRRDPARGALVNILGHINVLEAARRRGLKKIIYTSSIAAHPRGPLASPVNIYGVTKRADEDISKVYFLDHGICSIGLRPNVVYGYGRIVGETAVITEAIRAAAEGRQFSLPFAGSMCLQHIDEIVDVVLRCLAAEPAQPIVSDITTNMETMDDLIAAIIAVEPEAQINSSEIQRPAPAILLDASPLCELIGQWEKVPLRKGVERTMAHFRRH
jgi:nucleoside-diphosphate-sugar epimerase